ncbi:MAG: type II toxin-antitoxin system VapC family toxin [Rhizomicrobium sp.]
MNYLLDSNAVIALMRRTPPQVRDAILRAEAAGHEIFLSSISLQELWYGVARSSRPAANLRALRELLAQGRLVWPFDADDAEATGNIRGALSSNGKPIGPYDVLIAGQAVRRNATLVTANEKEFRRVPGLRWENWAVSKA